MIRIVLLIAVAATLAATTGMSLLNKMHAKEIEKAHQAGLARERQLLWELVMADYSASDKDHHWIIERFIDFSTKNGKPKYIYRVLGSPGIVRSTYPPDPPKYKYTYPPNVQLAQDAACFPLLFRNQDRCHGCHESKRIVLGQAELCTDILAK